VTTRPLDFVYQVESATFDLTPFETDEDLVRKIQTGKGDPTLYSDLEFISIESVFAGTMPRIVDQSASVGSNNIESAVVSQVITSKLDIRRMEKLDLDDEWLTDFELMLEEKVISFNEESKHLQVYVFTRAALLESLKSDVSDDVVLFSIAVGLVGVYTLLALGGLSPIHMRCTLTLMGLLCIGLAASSGIAITFYFGEKWSIIHNLLPFLLTGLGVDDLFVVCVAIDQSPHTLSPEERIKEALAKAGPLITMTSLINVFTLLGGSLTTQVGLSSFCVYAAVCVMMLYITVLTLFLPVAVWDL